MSETKRIFTYEEALATLPQVRELTRQAVQEIEALFQRVTGREDLDRRQSELDGFTQVVVRAWEGEIEKLGCEVKGLWLVDFDSGSGYYCWRYPEEALGYFHDYSEGFAGRVPIQ